MVELQEADVTEQGCGGVLPAAGAVVVKLYSSSAGPRLWRCAPSSFRPLASVYRFQR
jgi:hypothetical protein